MNEKNQTPRPCEVKGQACKFHGFARNDKVFINTEIALPERDAYLIARKAERRGVLPTGFSSQVVATTAAVIEGPDGRVGLVPVEKIRFTDATDRNVGDKVDEWIPVERELPEIGMPVLVYVPNFRPGRRIRIAAMTETGTWDAGDSYRFCWTKEAVTAWRPMPESPVREEELIE